MQRRLLPITLLTGFLFITALLGYILPNNSDGAPVRVLLENKGGKVILTHSVHSNVQKQKCVTCHHTSENDKTPPRCSDCHVKNFDDTFLIEHKGSIDDKYCVSCHHQGATIDKFSHERHETDYAEDDCQACHHNENIEQEPQACSNCHKKEASQDIISLKNASHTKCSDCHDDMFQEGTAGCGNCHSRKEKPVEKANPQSCDTCHSEPVNMLIPTTKKAFHTQCMGCHENQGKGPFGDDACYQCHMK